MADRDNLGLKVQVVSVSEYVAKKRIMTIQTEFSMTYYAYSEKSQASFIRDKKIPSGLVLTLFVQKCVRELEKP